MPHTNRKKPAAPATFQQAQFINVTVDKDSAAKIKALEWTLSSLDEAIKRVSVDGYKISLRYDERNDCFACWLIPPAGDKNAGCILSGRGSLPHKALKQALYIHFVMLEGDWVADHGQQTTAIDD